ncbi:MAG: DUF6788 family protein [Candidatus Heimdallarchaeaceae archaeon]
MSPLDSIVKQLQLVSHELEKEIEKLSNQEHIFGLISSKYIRCGKNNCKCAFGKQYYHGPYFYLRREPDYKYREYLGKEVPQSIKEQVEVGNKLKETLRKKRKIDLTLQKLANFL